MSSSPSSYFILGNEGRIGVQIRPIYNAVSIPAPRIRTDRFLLIMPFINPLVSNTLPNNYILYKDPNDPNTTVNIFPNHPNYPSNQREVPYDFLEIFENKVKLLRIDSFDKLFNSLSIYSNYSLEDKIRIMEIAFGIDYNYPLYTLLSIITRMGYVDCIFVDVTANGWPQLVTNYFDYTNLNMEYDILLEGGLRYVRRSDLISNPSAQTAFIVLLNNLLIDLAYKLEDNLIAMDAPINRWGRSANDFMKSYLSSIVNDSVRTKIVSNAGWLMNKTLNRITPPSFVYASHIYYMNQKGKNRFNSIVNKNINFLNIDKLYIRDSGRNIDSNDVYDLVNIEENQQNIDPSLWYILQTNSLYEINNYPVFLTDYNHRNNKDILRYENVYRAAIFAKKVITNIVTPLIGTKNYNLDYLDIQRNINQQLSVYDYLNMRVVINEDENVYENRLIMNLYLSKGITTYKVFIDFFAASV
jgi:hypothetical protein